MRTPSDAGELWSRVVLPSAGSRCFRWSTTLALCLAVCVGFRAPTLGAADVPQEAIVRILDTYSAGRYDEAMAQMVRWTDFFNLTGGFRKGAPRWIAAVPAPAHAERRRVVALVSLEIARLGFIGEGFNRMQQDLALEIVEFGCSLVRSDEPTSFERLWLRGSVALLHGAQNHFWETSGPRIQDHVKHARSRFPADGRFRLAEVLTARAARRIPNRPGTSPWSMVNGSTVPLRPAEASREVQQAIDGFSTLRDDPEVGAEARLRHGILLFHRTDFAGSLADVQAAARTSSDPYVTHVAHLFAGLALEMLDRHLEAVAAYESALHVMPHARSAAVALALDLFASGRREESAALLQATFKAPAPPDPWHEFTTGDYRFWTATLGQLREAIHR